MSEQTQKIPRNLAAILDWCLKYRPDLYPVVQAEKNNDGFILLMTVGFEAGRHFQHSNPEFPLDQAHLYLEQAVEVPVPAAPISAAVPTDPHHEIEPDPTPDADND